MSIRFDRRTKMENCRSKKNRGTNASIEIILVCWHFKTNLIFASQQNCFVYMTINIPILPLTSTEKVWLEEVYKRNHSGLRFSKRDVWSALHDRIPRNFRPPSMDPRLIDASGEHIRLLGIIALQGNSTIAEKVNLIIDWIRTQLLAAPATSEVSTEAIASGVGLSQGDVQIILSTINEFGHFFRSSKYIQDKDFISSIELRGDDDVYYQYIGYPGIAQLITEKSYEQFRQPVESFTFDEIQSLSAKIDALVIDMQNMKQGHDEIKLGQEAIWTDIREDLEELKALFFLGKKTWRQLLFGKVAEMTVSGIVSDTISKWVEDILKPELLKILPW